MGVGQGSEAGGRVPVEPDDPISLKDFRRIDAPMWQDYLRRRSRPEQNSNYGEIAIIKTQPKEHER